MDLGGSAARGLGGALIPANAQGWELVVWELRRYGVAIWPPMRIRRVRSR